MWNPWGCLSLVLGCVILAALGCQREIKEVTIEMVPTQGCAPLRVELIGRARTQAGVQGAFHWTIDKNVHLKGTHVSHTFTVPGTYDISLAVISENQTKTRVATLEVRKAEWPRAPGLYVQHGCVYQAIPETEPSRTVENLGKTSLQDLEEHIEQRKLSTPELLTHPLWRRDHTHTTLRVDRDQFVEIRLEHFQAHGFILLGEGVNEVSLFQVPVSPELEQAHNARVVTRVVDSWGLENVAPQPQPLTRTRTAATALQFLPAAQLTEGLYFIEVKHEDKATPGMHPVALVDSQP